MLDKIKLKWKIFAYILLFAAIIIMIFCLFQIFLLEPMYKNTKTNNIGKVFDEVEIEVEQYKLNDLFSADMQIKFLDIANDSETAIYLFEIDGNEYDISFSKGDYFYEFEDYETFEDIINKARFVSPKNKFYITFDDSIPVPNEMDYPAITKDPISSIDSAIVCAKIIKIENIEFLLVLDARFAPVDPAIETLKQQLIFISIIVVILSILMALFVSFVISRPIRKMTDAAKLLAAGKRDITFKGRGYSEIVELNTTLNYAVSELNKTEELQKELLANVSHDLKTPITLIGGYAELMKDIPTEMNNDNIQLIVDECNRLNLLVNDLLNLSRLQSKTEIFNYEKFNLNDLIKGIVDRNNKFYEQKNINLNFIYEDTYYVNADYKKIEQVIYNFIVNAINYSGDSKTIDIILETNNDNVKVSVKDYGIGIKQDEINLIWNRYYRVDKTHQRSVHGTGLGLSIVKEILETHGFKYGVISEYEKGSIFYFEMPIVK